MLVTEKSFDIKVFIISLLIFKFINVCNSIYHQFIKSILMLVTAGQNIKVMNMFKRHWIYTRITNKPKEQTPKIPLIYERKISIILKVGHFLSENKKALPAP